MEDIGEALAEFSKLWRKGEAATGGAHSLLSALITEKTDLAGAFLETCCRIRGCLSSHAAAVSFIAPSISMLPILRCAVA